MPTHTPDERRKRLRDKLAQDILDRRAALERSQRSAAQRVSPDPRQRMAAIFNRPIGKPVPPRAPQPGLLNRLLLGGTGSELVRGAEVLGRRLVTPAADVVRGRGLPSVQEVFNRFPERLKQPPDRPGAGLGRALSTVVGGTRPLTGPELDNPLLQLAVAVPPATPLAPLAGPLLGRAAATAAPIATKAAAAAVPAVRRSIRDLATSQRGGLLPKRPTVPPATAPKAALPEPAPVAPAPAAPAARVSPQEAADRLAAVTPEQHTVASLNEQLDDLAMASIELEGKLEAAQGARIVRPRWATGLSNSQVEGIARHEGKNPFLTDWGDGIDQVFVKSVRREGLFKESQDTITSLRQQRAGLNRDARAAEAELAELQILEASAKRTAEVRIRLSPPKRAAGEGAPPTRAGIPVSERAAPGTEAYLPELPTIEQVLDVNFKDNWARTLGQRLNRIPVVGPQVVDQVNPSVLAMDTPHKGIISYLTVRDAGDSSAVAGMHAIDELRHAFKVDKLGRVTNVKLPKGASADIGDVLTFPNAYPLNEAQREYARRAKALLDKNLASQRQRGVKIKPITSFDDAARQISLDVDLGGGRYFPRVVTKRVVAGEEAEIGRGPIKGAIGAKQTQAKPRSWPTQRQGREQGGNIYLADPTETLRITLMAGRRAEADAILAEFIRKQPGVGTVVERLKTRFPETALEREVALHAERSRQFARNLLQRVIRGETPAQPSMAKLRRDFPQMAADVEKATGIQQPVQPPLGEVRPTFRTPGVAVTERARRRVLDPHIAALEDLADGSRRRVADARAGYNQAKLRVQADPVTEAQVGQPAFQGLIMPKEMAEQINLHLTDQAPKILQSISSFNDVLRMLETGLDPGFLLIQGLIPLLTKPLVWGKATSISLRSLAQPAVANKYFQLPATREVMDKMVQFGAAPLASSEFVAAGRGSVLSRLPVAGTAFRRGADTFNAFLDVGRIEMHKALGVLAKNKNDYRELTTSIDQMFGVMSSRQLGVTPTRRAVEGSLLLYAPRYRRAGAALMLAVFQGGLRGQVARKALSHFLFGSMAFMTGLAAALGQWDRLDPKKGRNGIPRMYDIRYGDFLSVGIGDSVFGVGGVTVSGLRFLGNLSRGLSEDGVKGAALSAYRSFRGMTSPFTSDVFDLVTGKAAFTGEDTRSPLGLGRMLSEDLMPFYVEPFTTAGLEALAGVKRQAVGIETFVGNLIGTRERGISPYEKRTMARDQWAVNSGQATLEGQPVKEWGDLNRAQQKGAERQQPELERLMEEIDDLNYRRADKNTQVRLDVVREEREDFEAEMTTAAESMARGLQGASRKWYDKERSRIRAEHRGATNVLWAIRALGDAGSVKELEKWILENQRLEDAVSDLYFERREKMLDAIPVKTSLDWDRINLLLDRWLVQTYGSAIRDYVLAHKDDWMLSMPDTVRDVELQRQREIGSGLWFNFYDRPLRLNIQTPRPAAPGQAPQPSSTPAPAGPPQPTRPIRVPGFVR